MTKTKQKKVQNEQLNTTEANNSHSCCCIIHAETWCENLENGEFLSLLLYGEGGVRVEDDGGAGGLCVQLPLLGDPRSLGAWSMNIW